MKDGIKYANKGLIIYIINMCHRNIKEVSVMILKSSISFLRKMFENDMYFISTETGNVVFLPETVSKDDIVTDNEE